MLWSPPPTPHAAPSVNRSQDLAGTLALTAGLSGERVPGSHRALHVISDSYDHCHCQLWWQPTWLVHPAEEETEPGRRGDRPRLAHATDQTHGLPPASVKPPGVSLSLSTVTQTHGPHSSGGAALKLPDTSAPGRPLSPGDPPSRSVCDHTLSCQKCYKLSFLFLSLHVSSLPFLFSSYFCSYFSP